MGKITDGMSKIKEAAFLFKMFVGAAKETVDIPTDYFRMMFFFSNQSKQNQTFQHIALMFEAVPHKTRPSPASAGPSCNTVANIVLTDLNLIPGRTFRVPPLLSWVGKKVKKNKKNEHT